MSGVMSLGKKVIKQNSGARERTKQTNTSPADVIMWSGCKDSQTVSIVESRIVMVLTCRVPTLRKLVKLQAPCHT